MTTQTVSNFRNIHSVVRGSALPPSQEFTVWAQTLVNQINQQFDEVNTKITKITGGTAGNIPRIAADGSLEDSDVPGNFAAAGFDLAEAVSPAAAVSAIQVTTGTDRIALATFNAALTTLTTEINALKTTLNEVITNLKASGIMEE